MKMFIIGTLIFLLGLCLHVLIWRIRPPKRQKTTLAGIFFSALLVSVVYLKINMHLSIYECAHIGMFVVSLVLAYLITYTAIDAESPSLVIIMDIAKSGEAGLGRNELQAVMTDQHLVIPRIDDLVKDGFVSLDKQKYRLTSKGVWFIQPFILYRVMLGLKKGG